MLEHAVFLHLARGLRPLYYFLTRQRREVDFYVTGKPAQLIQVTWDLKDAATKERELRALKEAMEETGLERGLILTFADEETITTEGKRIDVMPVSKWILEEWKA